MSPSARDWSASPVPDVSGELVARVAMGDAQAFDIVVRTLLEPLLDYAFSFVQSRDVAQDLVQEVFCWMWDRRETLNIQGSVRGYLFSAVRHRAIDSLRRAHAEDRWEARYAREDDTPGMSTSPSAPPDRVERHDLATNLRRAIDTLPERRRDIVLLRWRQLSYAEIAEVMGISVKTVEAQVTRAFETLRDRLRDDLS